MLLAVCVFLLVLLICICYSKSSCELENVLRPIPSESPPCLDTAPPLLLTNLLLLCPAPKSSTRANSFNCQTL